MAKEVKTVFESLRTLNGFSLQEVADELGVTPTYIGQIESGKRELSRNVLEGLSKVYGMKPSQLLYLSEMVEENKHKYNYRASLGFLFQKLAELQEIKNGNNYEKITMAASS